MPGCRKPMVNTRGRYPEIDRLKGILIALVVLGHNALFSDWSPRAFNLLYNFHVAAFLLLPFLFNTARPTRGWLADRATRYLVPQFLFFAVACVAYFVIFVPKDAPGVLAWFQSVMLAVVLSSETAYNDAAGFRIFWFLPALLTLVAVRAYYVHAGRVGKTVVMITAVAAHLGVGLVPADWLKYIPWGLPIALFVFPVGLLAGAVWRYDKESPVLQWLFAALFLFCVVLSWSWNANIALAGEPRVHSLLELEWLLFHDVFLLSALFGLLLVARCLPVRVLELLGSASLLILLTHGLVWQSLDRLGVVSWIQAAMPALWAAVLVSYALTLAACLALYGLLQVNPRLWSRVFPRDRALWKRGYVSAGT